MSEEIKWYEKSGAEGDVVISSRIRLARNLRSLPFPEHLNDAGKQRVLELVQKEAMGANSLFANRFTWIPMTSLSKTAAVSMVERHLVSPEFISRPQGRALLLSKEEEIAVMVNGQDHLRLQVMKEGLSLKEAWKEANHLDDVFNERLSFAFDDRLGYLTQSPADLGTGLRASLVLHLPALEEGGIINRTIENLSKLGLSLRGVSFGEREEAVGSLYRLSNQVTLGLSEEEAITNLSGIAMQLIRQERGAREKLIARIEVQDMVARSLGILRTARILSAGECMKLLSNVRLGVYTGMISGIPLEQLNRLSVLAQPATLRLPSLHEESSGEEPDIMRARIFREALED